MHDCGSEQPLQRKGVRLALVSLAFRQVHSAVMRPEAIRLEHRRKPPTAMMRRTGARRWRWHGDDETRRTGANWANGAFPRCAELILLIGIDDETARARLLRLGFGDVTGSSTNLHEIEARALRIAAQAETLPRMRRLGQLLLDLFARDGFAHGRRLGLHPREFALIWRLSDSPGEAVTKKMLIRDVWRMAYVPETNSLAVHVFRLRAKLASAGLEWMVQTTRWTAAIVSGQQRPPRLRRFHLPRNRPWRIPHWSCRCSRA